MKIFNVYIKIVAFAAILFTSANSFAVTRQEMDQARTIAAKAYIRYVNDGSGYLDDLNPKTMEELEKLLKPKEKENIKAFKAIPVPTDYKDWGKEQLVEYWAVTAFQNKGLQEKGRGGRIRARAQINKMTIAPPQPEVTTPSPAASTNPLAAKATDSISSIQNPAVEASQLAAAENALSEGEEADYDDLNVDKATNYTWVYIMILAILVAVVLALVVYAANVFKKNGNQNYSGNPQGNGGMDSETQEHYESIISDKDVEIAMITKKLESAQRQNSDLKSKIEALERELANLRTSTRMAPANERPQHEQPSEFSPTPKPTLRSIYLGRANQRGIFVRADRTLNMGHSVFVLNTSDGYSGSFKVADSPAAWSLALSNPAEYLETACIGHNLGDTSEASKIVTESAGTAVFEGGCWRVTRKAKIRYE